MTTPPTAYDLVVIGAGIVGSAIARELSGHQLSVALIEAATTSVTAPARRTPRSCTPASTPSPAPWNRSWCTVDTTCSPTMPSTPAYRSNTPAPSWSPGTRSSWTPCPT